MNMDSIAFTDLNTGEIVDVFGTLPDSKFLQRGYKMYNNSVLGLVDILTKEEMKRTINLYDAKLIDYNNILMKSFLELTSDMSKAARSRYKHKLLGNHIIQEYANKIMLNPYTFVSRGDKNIRNCQYLTQRVWKYMFEDTDTGSEDVIKHAEHMFGPMAKSKTITVGSGAYAKSIPSPKGF